MSSDNSGISDVLIERFGSRAGFVRQETKDGVTTLWTEREFIVPVLKYLKTEVPGPFKMLYDLTAIDERARESNPVQPGGDFTVVYHLTSLDRNEDIRLKVPLKENDLAIPTLTGVWESANWYEREVFDMFGIRFDGHPRLARILMPESWKGHPLRKDHHARATEQDPFVLTEQKRDLEDENLRFKPEDHGLARSAEDSDFMFLNIGPQHTGTHGLLRLVVQLNGEDIVNIVPEIGFHHRGAEKMGERQSWHTFIPYTDRIDYLGGVMNNLAYLLSVEKLAGIEVPDRAMVIRVMMSELFRIASHLVWLGTFAQDLGQLSPVFYTFNDRERIFDIVIAITGARMHPSWFRIGGVAHDLPDGWQKLMQDFVNYLPARLREFDKVIIKNRIFKARTVGIGVYTAEEAIEWGLTGSGLRAAGYDWDYRKKRPYSGIDRFDFDIPLGKNGDCYDRAVVRMEEMRQSLRIIQQCIDNMPAGHYKSDHPLVIPPRKEKTMTDIETLITHFVGVSWGPVIPAGEAMVPIEAAKGSNGYYLVSDGSTSSYRSRIRTPSFPHMQMLPFISRGYTIPDLLSILGAMDFVLADLDR
ncbi:MAG TPA: NADH-quinone oxidoreductase subunit C/D [Bacteroidales bacterium]|nr:NADH-quinone oxidoreductase subunit C/D [Bacteroidales bacterium]